MRTPKQILIAGGIGLLALALLFVGRAHGQDAPPPDVAGEPQPGQQPDVAPPPANAPNASQTGYPAQSAGPQQPGSEPGVARLSFIHGDVSMQRGDSGENSTATINTPLEQGDKVLTGPDSRTEIELDAADILRLEQNAEATIATLSNNRVQVQIGQGLASYSVMRGGNADVEIDTPNVAVHPLREGRYRVLVVPGEDTIVTVRDGEAEISTPQGSAKVKKGDLITIKGIGEDAQYKITPAPSDDDFDRWNSDRDRIIYNAQASQQTNHNYTGASDLDSYGVWNEVPDYGPVWVPSVDAGWAPYREGRWVWEPYWGWTWTSYEPWGWAPYHYGRWFMYGSRWAWWPGPVYAGYRPIWAPAYVSFFGFGGGVGVSFGFGFGFGSIGWLPIGPGDYFHPWWGGWRDHFAVVGFDRLGSFHEGFAPLHGGGGFSNLHDVMVNDRLRAGVSGLPAGSFGHGGAIARSVSAADFRGARALTGNVPVVPGRDSLRTSDRAVNPSLAARGAQQQRFFSRMTPAARPESFSQATARTQSAMQRSNVQFHGSSAGAGGYAGARSFNGGNAGTTYRPQAEQGQGREAQNNGGWNRFGGQSGSSDVRSSNSPRGAEGQGSARESAQPGYQTERGEGQSQIYRGSSPNSYEGQGRAQSGGTYRPPLDMNKPIVTQRSPQTYGGQANRGNSGAYGGRSYESSPAYRQSAPTPNYRTAPSYNGNSGGYRGGSSGSYGGAAPRVGGSGGGSSRGGSSGRSSGGHGGSSRR